MRELYTFSGRSLGGRRIVSPSRAHNETRSRINRTIRQASSAAARETKTSHCPTAARAFKDRLRRSPIEIYTDALLSRKRVTWECACVRECVSARVYKASGKVTGGPLKL